MTRLRHTARGIVVHSDQILLMERWRPGKHYFSIPGGAIEANETSEQAVIREIYEETTIDARVLRKVLEMHDGNIVHEIYLCQYFRGEPHLPEAAPESLHATQDNRFQPGWIPIARLPELPFIYWQPLQQPLIHGLQNGFGKTVAIVNAKASR